MALLEGLAGDTVYLDEVHSMPSRLARARMFLAEVYSLLKTTEIRYALTALLVLAVVKVEWSTGEREQKESEADRVDAVLRRHPEWDRRLLEQLEEERKRAHGAE
jgi:hypothetical protein